jgi:hypothetical protein
MSKVVPRVLQIFVESESNNQELPISISLKTTFEQLINRFNKDKINELYNNEENLSKIFRKHLFSDCEIICFTFEISYDNTIGYFDVLIPYEIDPDPNKNYIATTAIYDFDKDPLYRYDLFNEEKTMPIIDFLHMLIYEADRITSLDYLHLIMP